MTKCTGEGGEFWMLQTQCFRYMPYMYLTCLGSMQWKVLSSLAKLHLLNDFHPQSNFLRNQTNEKFKLLVYYRRSIRPV